MPKIVMYSDSGKNTLNEESCISGYHPDKTLKYNLTITKNTL